MSYTAIPAEDVSLHVSGPPTALPAIIEASTSQPPTGPYAYPPSTAGSNNQRRPLTGYVAPTPPGVSNTTPGTFAKLSTKIEDLIATISRPLKPHVPRFGRFLLVSTFLEDALRIISQWNDQAEYLSDDQHYSRTFSTSFLACNVVLMISCSILVIIKRWSFVSFPGLIVVMFAQGLIYDLFTDITFLCLNLSLVGGLLFGLSDTLEASSTVRAFAGLPEIDEDTGAARRKYLQLTGRILLVGFFIGQMVLAWVRLSVEVTPLRLVIAALALIACFLVVLGFKARGSALFLVIISASLNVISNNWWAKPKDHPERDFRKYDFFQVLSIVGGLILLVNQGPGGISLDEKRKVL